MKSREWRVESGEWREKPNQKNKKHVIFFRGAVLRNVPGRGTKRLRLCVVLYLACPTFCPAPGQTAESRESRVKGRSEFSVQTSAFESDKQPGVRVLGVFCEVKRFSA